MFDMCKLVAEHVKQMRSTIEAAICSSQDEFCEIVNRGCLPPMLHRLDAPIVSPDSQFLPENTWFHSYCRFHRIARC